METVNAGWALWQILLMLLAIMASWSLIIIAALRVMFTRSLKTIEDKMSEFAKTATACSDLEREFLEFKAELPLKYMMREDFIRFEVGINYKMDKLRDLFSEGIKSNYNELRGFFIDLLKQTKTGESK